MLSWGTVDVETRAAFIHREIVQLCCLGAVAVAAFFLTRAVAANNSATRMKDAAEWYRQGEQALAAGKANDAVSAFRRATARDRGRKPYVLALAQALARNNDTEAARIALLSLRESAPEDPDVNLALARVAAARRDPTEALRFYHSALYAPWTAERPDARRAIRIELIRFLLAEGQPARADAEVLALASDTPDEAPRHVEVGRLFMQSGDEAHAVDQFDRALRLDPNDADALAGAGVASFRLGRYADALRHLGRAVLTDDTARRARDVAELVLSRDPFAARIGPAERRRRLLANVTYADARLTSCMTGEDASAPNLELRTARDGLAALQPQLKAPTLDQDAIEAATDAVGRAERVAAQHCGPASALDEALTLIARQHGQKAA